MVKGREAWRAASPWGHKESDMTDQRNNNKPSPLKKKIDLVGTADQIRFLRDFPDGLVVKTSPST